MDAGVTTGFAMGGHTLRFPDVHVTQLGARWQTYDEDAGGWPRFAPDVAIEVVSPSNTSSELALTAREYFVNGAAAMWIVDPDPRAVTIRRPGAARRGFQFRRRDDR